MVTELQKENSYQEAFRALQKGGGVVGSSRLSQLREGAMGRFVELGFPSVKEEEWKYTNITAIARADFRPAVSSEQPPASEAELEPISSVPETSSSQLVFVDGALRSDLSVLTALPQQIVAMDLGEAMDDERDTEIVRTHLARQADYVVNGFTALNTAFINRGAFVYVPKDVAVDAPIHLLFIASSERTANFPRVLIVAGRIAGLPLLKTTSALLPKST